MSIYNREMILPSSRAFWDDDDFETMEEDETKNFNIDWIEKSPSNIDKLLIIESEFLNDFAKTCLVKDLQKVCIIKNEQTKKEPTTIYKTKQNLYICVVGVEVDLPKSGDFLKEVQNILKLTKEIIIVTCDHITHFKGKNDEKSASFLRSLCTKNARDLCKNVPRLSQPNIVSGVSAGVFAYAEVMEIPAIMYILYTDTFALDSTSIVPLQNLLSATVDFAIPNYATSTKGFFSKENLYI